MEIKSFIGAAHTCFVGISLNTSFVWLSIVIMLSVTGCGGGDDPSDTTIPVITILGANPASIVQGATYSDAGATAADNVDGSVSVTTSGTVDTSTVGTYTITYTATDNAGNTATATRTVEVLDGTPPVITVLGANPASIVQGVSYADAGATATDNVDGSVSVTTSGTVDTSTVGTYTITYTATDNAGNTATATRTVEVLDGTPPVITVLGANPASIVQGATYADAGATATDDVDGSVSVTTSGTVDTSTVGTYTITYTATDNAGNTATATRTVNVTTVNLSGTVNSAVGSAADSDVNDPNASYAANDSPAQAQSISNPVILGGYLNVANTGPAGTSFTPGDVSDFFRVSMVANQSITVNIADISAGDMDLYLYFDDGNIDVLNPDFTSIGIGTTEVLTVSQAGDYVIEVHAYSGYSNYTLVVGQSAAYHSTERLVSTDDFVPGEVIVRFNDNLLTLSTMQTPSVRAASLGLQFKTGANGKAMLLGLGDIQNRQASFKALGITSGQAGGQVRNFRSAVPEKQLKMDTLQVIKALRKRKDVLYAEPNYIRQAKQTPTDNYYDLQWHYPLINLPSAWDVSTGVSNVIVAVIDTGVLLNHPDLQGQFSADGGYDFILSDTISQDGEPGIDSNADDPGDSTLGSSSFHGTHVSGTIAAATMFTAGGIDVAGVAPGVKIMPLRVLGNGGGTSYDINQAVRYAAGLSNDSGIILTTNKADIINLSLGGGAYSQMEQDTYTQARNAGVVIVAAAGNESVSTPSYPAAYDGVISVSAVDINKQLAPYSNFGTTVDVAAPGGDTSQDINGDGYADGVLSTAGEDSSGSIEFVYKFYNGTSMAAPHMAGVVALMKSVYSGLTPVNVDSSLNSGQITQDLGDVGRDDLFGHGLIDARKAVDVATSLASGTPPEVPFLSISPASLNFGTSETSAFLSVVNGGSGTLNITSVTDDATWLTVTPASVDVSTQLGNYQVTVDRSSLTVGIYTASIIIVSSASTNTVPVIMQVVAQDISADVGYQYILMIDVDTNNIINQWDGNALDGNYSFQFNNVVFSSGQSFYIYAGTDLNNNGLICDAGEACGAYITLDQPKAITATDSYTGLDFISGFNIGLQNLSVTDIPTRGIAIRRQQTRQIQTR